MRIVEPAPSVALEALEGLVRQGLTDEALREATEVANSGRATPNARALGWLLEDVYKLYGLAALDHGLRRHKRHSNVEPDIDHHGPEQGVRDVIEAGKPEQRIGTEQRKPPRTVLHEAL
ncbi:hypothetical protein ACF1BQ_005765 [Bradyrhizobium sp. RDT10]